MDTYDKPIHNAVGVIFAIALGLYFQRVSPSLAGFMMAGAIGAAVGYGVFKAFVRTDGQRRE